MRKPCLSDESSIISTNYGRVFRFKRLPKISNNSKLAIEFQVITTAFHEAGHTIAALLSFTKVSAVAVEIDHKKKSFGQDLGYTHYEPAVGPEDVEDSQFQTNLVFSEICINYAGLAAEKLFYKEICGTDNLPMFVKHGSYQDRNVASSLIKKYNLAPPGKKRYGFKKKMFSQTQRLLFKHWGDVKLVAHALFQRKKLYHQDLKDLLSKKSINKKFWKEQFKKIAVLFESNEELHERDIKKLMKF
jgi:hypothetical protein